MTDVRVFSESDENLETSSDPNRPWLTLRLGKGAVCPPISVDPGLPAPASALIEIGNGSNITGSIIVWGETSRDPRRQRRKHAGCGHLLR